MSLGNETFREGLEPLAKHYEEILKLLGEDPPSYRIAYRWYLDDEPIMYLIANDASARNVSSLTSHTRRFKSSTIHTE